MGITGADARRHFAGLDNDWVYLDNAGGSFALKAVIDRVAEYMASTPVQLGATYPCSVRAAERQAKSLESLARFVNARHPTEIVLGSSSTALTWQAARAMRPLLKPGDEIIITEMDHEANRSPWLSLVDLGVKIRTWKIERDSFALSLAHLDALLNEHTKLVCFSQCSNVLGRIEPAREITRRVHAVGAKVFVDGVAFAPHARIDVQELDVDFYVFSLYKVFGPHIGLLYGKRDLLLELGNINHAYLPMDSLPYKLQPGGVSYELAFGATGMVDYFESDSADRFEAIRQHEASLVKPLLEFLVAQRGITLFGPSDVDASRAPIVSFRADNATSARIAERLQRHQIAVKHGHFHARRLLENLGIDAADGVVRISFAHYNTKEEVDRLIKALEETLPAT